MRTHEKRPLHISVQGPFTLAAMLIELIGGPSDGHVVNSDSPPLPDIRVPIDPPPPSALPWNIHQDVSEKIPQVVYRLTVRPNFRSASWVYVFADQYQQLTRRWRS